MKECEKKNKIKKIIAQFITNMVQTRSGQTPIVQRRTKSVTSSYSSVETSKVRKSPARSKSPSKRAKSPSRRSSTTRKSPKKLQLSNLKNDNNNTTDDDDDETFGGPLMKIVTLIFAPVLVQFMWASCHLDQCFVTFHLNTF